MTDTQRTSKESSIPPLPKPDGFDRRVEGHYCAKSMLEFAALAAINARRDSQNEIEQLQLQKSNLLETVNSKQARIDALMLEFCPSEMSAEQRAEWSESQRVAHEPVPTAPNEQAWLAIGWGEGSAEMRVVHNDKEMVQWLWEQCGPDHTGNEESTRNYWYSYLENADNWMNLDGLPRWSCEIDIGETGHVEFQLLHGLNWPTLEPIARYRRESVDLSQLSTDDFITCMVGLLVSTPMGDAERNYLNEAKCRLAQPPRECPHTKDGKHETHDGGPDCRYCDGTAQPPPTEVAAAAARVANEIGLFDDDDPFRDDLRVLVAAVMASQPPRACEHGAHPPTNCAICTRQSPELGLYRRALQHIAYEPLTDDPEASAVKCLEEATRIARGALAGPTMCPDCGGTKQTLADRGNFDSTLGPCPRCSAQPREPLPLHADISQEEAFRRVHGASAKHERRVVGHVSGWQEQMDTCVCGEKWPCPRASKPPSTAPTLCAPIDGPFEVWFKPKDGSRGVLDDRNGITLTVHGFVDDKEGRKYCEELANTLNARASQPQGTLPEIGGDTLPATLADFERACKVHLAEEQAKINPDNALISTLCNAVRLARENERMARASQPPGTVTNQQIDNLLFSLRSNWPAEGYERDVKRQSVRTWLAASGWGASQPPGEVDRLTRALRHLSFYVAANGDDWVRRTARDYLAGYPAPSDEVLAASEAALTKCSSRIGPDEYCEKPRGHNGSCGFVPITLRECPQKGRHMTAIHRDACPACNPPKASEAST